MLIRVIVFIKQVIFPIMHAVVFLLRVYLIFVFGIFRLFVILENIYILGVSRENQILNAIFLIFVY